MVFPERGRKPIPTLLSWDASVKISKIIGPSNAEKQEECKATTIFVELFSIVATWRFFSMANETPSLMAKHSAIKGPKLPWIHFKKAPQTWPLWSRMTPLTPMKESSLWTTASTFSLSLSAARGNKQTWVQASWFISYWSRPWILWNSSIHKLASLSSTSGLWAISHLALSSCNFAK